MTVATTTTSSNGHAKVSPEKARGLFEDSRPELPEPDWDFIEAQQPVWNFILDHYFRMEVRGWHRLPPAPSLIVGIHSGGILPIDAYAFGFSWFREFGRDRVPRATSHDFLMQAPVIGSYLSKIGSVPASHEGIIAALDGGQDVILYPGGDLDALRPWRKRDEVIFGGRKGWIRMALEAQVPTCRWRTWAAPTRCSCSPRVRSWRRRCASTSCCARRPSRSAWASRSG